MIISESELQVILARGHVKEHGAGKVADIPAKVEEKKVAGRKQTKTEAEAGRMLSLEFPGCTVIFHGLAFYLIAGHRYTADYCVHLPEGKILVVEVKQEGRNGFKQQSYRDAKVRFDQSRHEWPMFRFRWMTKTKDGWQVKDY